MTRIGAPAAVLGPVLLFLYYWSEETFGPSQPNGGALRMALGFQLIAAAMICFTIALLRLHSQRLSLGGRTSNLTTWLGRVAVGFLFIGSALWWPILFLWPDFGPIAGAPVALGSLSFLATWLLVGVDAARDMRLPTWARSLPFGLFALFFLLLYVTGTVSPWPVVTAVLALLAVGWFLLAYVVSISEPAEATPVALSRIR